MMRIALSLTAIDAIKSKRRGNELDMKTSNLVTAELIELASTAFKSSGLAARTDHTIKSDNLSITTSATLSNLETICTLRLNSIGESVINLDNILPIQIDPTAVTKFKNSAAFKRYFQISEGDTLSLTAIVSERQLTSRHFGTYLLHVMEQLKPFIALISTSKLSKAA